MAAHSGNLAWRMSGTEEPGRLQSVGLQRVGHGWASNTTGGQQKFRALPGAPAAKKTWWVGSTRLTTACVTVRALPGASSRTSVSAASKDPAISLNLREKQECKLLFSLLQVPLPQPAPTPGNRTLLLLARRASASEMPQQPWCLASTDFSSYWAGNKLIWMTWPGSHFWQVPPPTIR